MSIMLNILFTTKTTEHLVIINYQYTHKIQIHIESRKWGWIGHTLRKDPRSIARQSLDYNPPCLINWQRDLLARSKDHHAEDSGVEIHSGRPILPRGPKGFKKKNTHITSHLYVESLVQDLPGGIHGTRVTALAVGCRFPLGSFLVFPFWKQR